MERQEYEVLKFLVKEECDKLKNTLTDDEKSRIRPGRLDPLNPNMCLYGQITGNCYSRRAQDLIIACCTKVFVPQLHSSDLLTRAKLNGSPWECELDHTGFGEVRRFEKYHSPIEIYIHNLDRMWGSHDTINGEEYHRFLSNVGTYVRGEIETLEFPDYSCAEPLVVIVSES
jgi:hypothetical protein